MSRLPDPPEGLTKHDLDVLSAAARILQVHRTGWPDLAERLVSSDVPRLLALIDPAALDWFVDVDPEHHQVAAARAREHRAEGPR